jgi:hypothetical protein
MTPERSLVDRQKQVDNVVASVKLDARASRITVAALGQPPEGWTDQLIQVGRFTLKPDARIAATRKLANLKSDRSRIVTLAHLDAGSVFAVCKRPVALPAAQRPDRVFYLGDAPPNRGLFIGDPLEHDLDRISINDRRLADHEAILALSSLPSGGAPRGSSVAWAGVPE